MFIEKKQTVLENFYLPWVEFDSARAGFLWILKQKKCVGKKVLLPAYIGQSSREGSGVFDPIRRTKVKFDFYHLDRDLNIDLKDITAKIKAHRNQVLLLIHYFGFKDKNLSKIKDLAKKNKLVIVEDFAHGLYTFFNHVQLDFDYAFFSLHKMLPMNKGGLVLVPTDKSLKSKNTFNLYKYNLEAIARKRIENYEFLIKELRIYQKKYNLKILRPKLGNNIAQTLPILLESQALRDHLYFSLNKKGFGVVSLYHELVIEIDQTFKVEHAVAHRILNLPIHQDVSKNKLKQMAIALIAQIKNFR